MLWTILLILLILWLLGVVSGAVGNLIHLLLLVALVVLIIQLITGRRVAADGSSYAAQLSFPGTPAVSATAWFGSRRLSPSIRRATNRLLASLSVDPGYGCR